MVSSITVNFDLGSDVSRCTSDSQPSNQQPRLSNTSPPCKGTCNVAAADEPRRFSEGVPGWASRDEAVLVMVVAAVVAAVAAVVGMGVVVGASG